MSPRACKRLCWLCCSCVCRKSDTSWSTRPRRTFGEHGKSAVSDDEVQQSNVGYSHVDGAVRDESADASRT